MAPPSACCAQRSGSGQPAVLRRAATRRAWCLLGVCVVPALFGHDRARDWNYRDAFLLGGLTPRLLAGSHRGEVHRCALRVNDYPAKRVDDTLEEMTLDRQEGFEDSEQDDFEYEMEEDAEDIREYSGKAMRDRVRPRLPRRPPPRSEPYEGYFERRDLPKFDMSEVDRDGDLASLSLEELEDRAARRWNSKYHVMPTQRRPAIQAPGRRYEQRGYSVNKQINREVRVPEAPFRSTWGSFPPVAKGEAANVLGLDWGDDDEDPRGRRGPQVLPDAGRAPTQKRLDGWLMPNRARPERPREEKPAEDSIGVLLRSSSTQPQVSKFKKMYKAALRKLSPLPWHRVEGARSWTDPSDKTWQDLGITGANSERLVQVMEDYGVMEPNVLQAEAVPQILEGDDIVLSSGTGSGKTLAFLVPLLHKFVLPMADEVLGRNVDPTRPVHLNPKVWAKPRLLIVAPSRELAAQIQRILRDILASFPTLNSTLLIGGSNHKRQDESLKYRLPAVVVGTPGRIMDHAFEGRLDLSKLRAVVLDEIDMLLKVSRQDHLQMLVKALPAPHRAQRVLVSATGSCSDAAEDFAAAELRRPWRSIGPKGEVEMPSRVLHLVNGAPDVDKKMRFLHRLSTSNPMPDGVLVFCNNFERARKVAESLRYMDIPAEVLSGNRSKESRESAIRKMNQGKIDMLVATDVATRGLDFREMTHVVNFELPGDANTYAHRAGRCGRMGRNGIVISLGSGGRENRRLNKYVKELDFELFEANVQDGELCIVEGDAPSRTGLIE